MIPNKVKSIPPPAVELGTLRDLTPDDRNANKGTQRGTGELERSLRRHGAGRSILVDKKGRIIAGNKTAESAASIGLDDVIVVKTDGNQLVAVQRTDLDLDDPKARALAIADNRIAELNLDWDTEVLGELADGGVDLTGLFDDSEVDAALDSGVEDITALIDERIRSKPVKPGWMVLHGEAAALESIRASLPPGIECEVSDAGR